MAFPNIHMDFPADSVVKNPPAVQEIRVQSLGQEDPLEEGMAVFLPGNAWRTTVHGIAKGSDMT